MHFRIPGGELSHLGGELSALEGRLTASYNNLTALQKRIRERSPEEPQPLKKQAFLGLLGRALARVAPSLGAGYGAALARAGQSVGKYMPSVGAYLGGRGVTTMARAIPRMSGDALTRFAPRMARLPEWAGGGSRLTKLVQGGGEAIPGLVRSGPIPAAGMSEPAVMRAFAGEVPTFSTGAYSRELLPAMQNARNLRRAVPVPKPAPSTPAASAPATAASAPASAAAPATATSGTAAGELAEGAATAGSGAAAKPTLFESYKSVFEPGGLRAMWDDKWVKYPTYLMGAMEAPAVLRGEKNPLEAAFNILAPIPAMRAGFLPGVVASFAAPAVSRSILGPSGPAQAGVPMAQPMPPPPPVNVNVAAPSAPMPAMPPPMPSMIPGVRTV